MKELFTENEYCEKALEANELGEYLYIHVFDREVQVTVLDFDIIETEEEVVKKDEDGNIVYDEFGQPVHETITVETQVPVMEDVEIEVVVPVYDEDGNQIDEETETQTIQQQASHEETQTETVAELLIAPEGYYICYEENYTDGTLNPDFIDPERARLDALTLTRGDVFAGLIQARLMDENTLKAKLQQEMPETTTEEKMRKMLALNALTNALNFHRGHDLVNEIGAELEISEENLDLFFETGNYVYLLAPNPQEIDQEEESQDEPEPDDE